MPILHKGNSIIVENHLFKQDQYQQLHCLSTLDLTGVVPYFLWPILSTQGYNPLFLQEAARQGWVQYITVDIKSIKLKLISNKRFFTGLFRDLARILKQH